MIPLSITPIVSHIYAYARAEISHRNKCQKWRIVEWITCARVIIGDIYDELTCQHACCCNLTWLRNMFPCGRRNTKVLLRLFTTQWTPRNMNKLMHQRKFINCSHPCCPGPACAHNTYRQYATYILPLQLKLCVGGSLHKHIDIIDNLHEICFLVPERKTIEFLFS